MLECIECVPGTCVGEVLERYALSGSGMTYPRCDKGYDDYVDRVQPAIDDINRRYPKQAPSDFDPAYAGETWDEDY